MPAVPGRNQALEKAKIPVMVSIKESCLAAGLVFFIIF
jgi:hypothetical protein